ncbi:MAG: rane protein [Deltaproteobacteria bacterium]|nr:rane protein [Deltaproteobacteria bacterium]
MRKISALLVLVSALSACAPYSIMHGAESLSVLQDREDFRNCAHLGEAIGVAGSWWYYWAISNRSLTQWARNDLRNQALEMGGNRIRIEDQSNLYTTSVVFIGQVYRCPEGPPPQGADPGCR